MTIVFTLAVVVRVLFSLYQPNALITADSVGYFDLGVEMIKNPKVETLISEFRTPLYPVFLASFSKVLGFTGNSITDFNFEPIGKTISDVQNILGVVGVILFFLLLVRIGFSNSTLWVLSLLTVFNIFVFYWERSLLTEALATTTLFLSLVLFSHTLRNPNSKNFILLCTSYGVNFLLRPAFVFLPIVTLPFLFLTCKKRSEKINVFIAIVMSCLIPVLYITGNTLYHNYKGIQHIGDIDVLGRILEFDTPIEAAKTNRYFYEKVTEYRSRKGNPMPFEFINTYDATMYTNTTRMNELQAFTRSVVLHNFPSYTAHALATIPQAMTDVSPFMKIADTSLFRLDILFSGLFVLYHTSLQFTLLAFPLYPVAMYFVFKKKTTRRIHLAMIGSVVVSQIILTTFVVYREDYGRLFASIQPLLFVFIIGTLQELCARKNDLPAHK